ncbi:MAG TPA: NADPH-dependent F420 reductase [Thermoanaerobaculia bacterium]|nr:NADPH-dependent F420 reductase [Thermoanaerobaculia bacterium]
MSFPGAAAALRPFRLQHLYTLHRLVTDPGIAGFEVQLDGSQDLEIFDPSGRPVEVVRVKLQRGTPLAHSDLDSGGDSFFERAHRRLREQPAMVQRVACFGPVGRTLRAMSGVRKGGLDGAARVVLEGFGFSRKQIDAFIRLFAVDSALDDDAMASEVHAWLQETAAGLDPEAAFLYLSGWMHRAMERRRRITARDVRDRLAAAGEFEAELAANPEWLATVVPAGGTEVGAAADAGQELDDVDAAFEQRNVVVVHGAPARGKSALASRYLLTRMPSAWRFEVRAPHDAASVLRAARFLGVHAHAVGVPILFWLDIAPRDLSWTALAGELRVIRGMRLLVTAGEQEWARARNSGAMLMAADVPLSLDEEEAAGTGTATAAAELGSIAEEDLEALLLHTFSTGDAAGIAEAVAAVHTLQTFRFTGAAGVLRALLWLGVKRYTVEQAGLIDEVRTTMPGGTRTWMVLDPAGVTRYAPLLLAFEEELSHLPELQEWYAGLKERRPSSGEVFAEARLWLAAQPGAWAIPEGEAEWRAAAEVLFWTGEWSIPFDREFLAAAALDPSIPLPLLTDVVFAASFVDDGAFDGVRSEAIARFRRETTTVAIDRTADGLTAHWVLPYEPEPNFERVEAEMARRFDLLRRLFPAVKAFGSCSYGGVILEEKRDLPVTDSPVPWLWRVHLLFERFASLERRGERWAGYVEEVVEIREWIAQLAARVTQALTLYFRREKAVAVLGDVDRVEWDALAGALRDIPPFPRAGLDEWGVETEGPARTWNAAIPHAHAAYTVAFDNYAKAFGDFMATSWRMFIVQPFLGRVDVEDRERIAESQPIEPAKATLHLADTLVHLVDMQTEFRARFGLQVPGLAGLERREHAALWTFWAVFYDFAFHPRRRIANAAHDSVSAVETRLDDRRRALRRKLRAVQAKSEIVASRRREEPGPGLWVTIDVPHVGEVFDRFTEAFVYATEALLPPPDLNALDRYALDLWWELVHLVPLVRGKSVDRKAWTLVITDLPQPGEELSRHAWKLARRPVDEEVWHLLGFPSWPQSMGAEARRLADAADEWRKIIWHVANLRDVPLRDDEGRALLSSHWREAVAMAERAAATVDAGLAALPPEIVQNGNVEVLRERIASLRETITSAEPLDAAAVEEAAAAIAKPVYLEILAFADRWLDRELIPDGAEREQRDARAAAALERTGMLKIGVLGTGVVGHALANAFLALGHEVMMGARTATNEKALAWAEGAGPRASAGTFTDAADFGDVLVLATLGVANESVLRSAGPDHFRGKLVIDTTNPLDFSAGMPPKLTLSGTGSGGEAVQRLLPDARVVKAFNTVGSPLMFRPDLPGGPPDMFIAGNDVEAKKQMGQILNDFGWGVIDTGGIESSRYLEAMCMVWVLSALNTGDWTQAFKMLRG